jgi:hypothetical protein
MKKIPMKEGTWFAVPLQSSGFGVGLAARVSPKSGIILAYLFGEKYESAPTVADVSNLKKDDAIMVVRMGTLGLSSGEWPVIGSVSKWDRESWPNRQFIRQDELSKRAWKVTYADDDQNKIVEEVPVPYESVDVLDRDRMYGDGAAAIALSRRIYGLPSY